MQLQCSDGRASAYIKTTERWTKGVWPVLYHCTVAASRFRRASQQQPKGRPNELLYTYTLSFCFEMMIETHVNLFRIENTTCINKCYLSSSGILFENHFKVNVGKQRGTRSCLKVYLWNFFLPVKVSMSSLLQKCTYNQAIKAKWQVMMIYYLGLNSSAAA